MNEMVKIQIIIFILDINCQNNCLINISPINSIVNKIFTIMYQ